jgi:hypothetical protein
MKTITSDQRELIDALLAKRPLSTAASATVKLAGIFDVCIDVPAAGDTEAIKT